MSLHALAGHMAAKGRGSDSMLVHMTPEEVQSLQVLALRAGGTLTINPDTGLPEANFLKKMLPMIAGAALNFFAPGFGSAIAGGLGITGAGAAAIGTGIGVGGIAGLATGSLSRGLMAGLGAYGGASLAGGLESLGATAVAPEAMAAANASADPIMSLTAAKDAATAAGIAPAAGAEAAKQGLAMAANNPKSFMNAMGGPSGAFKSAYAAATPILAGEMVPTTTEMPDGKQTPSYIRPFLVDQYSQQMQALTPIDASKVRMRGERGFADGGIVALATGGVSDAQVASYIQNNALSGQALQDAADVFGISAAQLGRAQSLLSANDPSVQAASQAYEAQVAGRPDLVAQNLAYYNPAAQSGSGWEDVSINRWLQANPNASFQQMSQAAQGAGITNEDIQRAFDRYGYSGAGVHVATSPDWRNELGLTGLAGLSSNINRWVDKASDMDLTGAEKRALAYDAMLSSGMNMTDVLRATGKTIEELFPDTRKRTQLPSIVTPDGSYGSLTGATQTPGDIITNPDGSRTVVPNIPGRPVGGFTGMQQVKDTYTAGGGSLGYTPYAPKTIEEFNERFTTSGGSKQAYDFLMNKGAADIRRPITKTGELMLPYADVMGLRRPGRAVMPRKPVVKTEEVINPEIVTEGAANGGVMGMALGGLGALAGGGSASKYNLGSYSDGGRLLRGPGDGVSDSIPATIGDKQPARLADGEFVVPARIVSELGNGSTEAGARKLYAMMDRVQKARGKTTGKNRVAANTRADKYLPA